MAKARPRQTLTERLDQQIAALSGEKARIEAPAAAAVAEVDAKLAVLEAAKVAMTREVEAAYVALLDLGLIRELWMQNSGMCAPLSDGVKKTIATKAPAMAAPRKAPVPKAVNTHRAGGFAKHAKGGK